MAQLIVRRKGKQESTLSLETNREYIVGRGSESDLVLDNLKGISRQHFKLSFEEGQWTVRLLSRSGAIIFEGENVELIHLDDKSSFTVEPYEFVLSAPREVAQATDEDVAEEKSLVTLPTRGELRPTESEADYHASMDATQAGAPMLTAFLSVFSTNGEVAQVIKLEGRSWLAGREESCEIHLNHHHVSRKHFELARGPGGFTITDLDSANGTTLNGLPIEPQQAQPLMSGDTIGIMAMQLRFEIRDSQFENKIQGLQPWAANALPTRWSHHDDLPVEDFSPRPMPASTSPRWRLPKSKAEAKEQLLRLREHKLRVGIAALGFVLILGLLTDNEPPKQGTADSSSKVTDVKAVENLSAEQKKLVEKAFELAQAHYYSGKYELCSAEIKKIHELVPFFKDSKNLETYCTQALDLTMQNAERDRLAQQQKEIEQKIGSFVSECRGQMKDNTTLDQLNDCLASAIDLNPEHASILELRTQIEIRDEEKRAKVEAQAERQKAVQSSRQKYNSAQEFLKQGQLRKAIDAFEAFLRREYPELSDSTSQARRDLASARKELTAKVGQKLDECKRLQGESKFKDAVLACDSALQEDPANSVARDMRRTVLSDLRRDMKLLYQDSILEESLGNIEAAKAKWKQIIRDDLENEEYHQKARQKLRKYGGEG